MEKTLDKLWNPWKKQAPASAREIAPPPKKQRESNSPRLNNKLPENPEPQEHFVLEWAFRVSDTSTKSLRAVVPFLVAEALSPPSRLLFETDLILSDDQTFCIHLAYIRTDLRNRELPTDTSGRGGHNKRLYEVPFERTEKGAILTLSLPPESDPPQGMVFVLFLKDKRGLDRCFRNDGVWEMDEYFWMPFVALHRPFQMQIQSLTSQCSDMIRLCKIWAEDRAHLIGGVQHMEREVSILSNQVQVRLDEFNNALAQLSKIADSNLAASRKEQAFLQAKGQLTEELSRMRGRLEEAQLAVERKDNAFQKLSNDYSGMKTAMDNQIRRLRELEAAAAEAFVARMNADTKCKVLEGELRRLTNALDKARTTAETDKKMYDRATAESRREMMEHRRQIAVLESALAEMQTGPLASSPERQIVVVQQVEDTYWKEMYFEEREARKKVQRMYSEASGAVLVYCRLRGGIEPSECVSARDDSVDLRLDDRRTDAESFQFEKVFAQHMDNASVFAEVEPYVEGVLCGYSYCVLLYGETGSGKTYTMEGIPSDLGLLQRSLERMFALAGSNSWKCSFKVSYVEIYNELLRDLIPFQDKPVPLNVRERKDGTSFVEGLSTYEVTSYEEAIDLFERGRAVRASACTDLNEQSSRSHSIIMFTATVDDLSGKPPVTAQLILGDLAGSERLSKSNATGERQVETCHINKSLSALDRVVGALIDKAPHVPYRDSKLTHLLQGVLGRGNSKTQMIVMANPAENHLDETLCSMRFAARVQRVKLGRAVKNVCLDQKVEELKAALAEENFRRLQLEQELKTCTNQLALLQLARDKSVSVSMSSSVSSVSMSSYPAPHPESTPATSSVTPDRLNPASSPDLHDQSDSSSTSASASHSQPPASHPPSRKGRLGTSRTTSITHSSPDLNPNRITPDAPTTLEEPIPTPRGRYAQTPSRRPTPDKPKTPSSVSKSPASGESKSLRSNSTKIVLTTGSPPFPSYAQQYNSPLSPSFSLTSLTSSGRSSSSHAPNASATPNKTPMRVREAEREFVETQPQVHGAQPPGSDRGTADTERERLARDHKRDSSGFGSGISQALSKATARVMRSGTVKAASEIRQELEAAREVDSSSIKALVSVRGRSLSARLRRSTLGVFDENRRVSTGGKDVSVGGPAPPLLSHTLSQGQILNVKGKDREGRSSLNISIGDEGAADRGGPLSARRRMHTSSTDDLLRTRTPRKR